jgi:glycosyltransferase involved in cell wall biosynthesis
MGRCAVVVVPSLLPEAFGIAALEAQALGRPVIASAHGGLPDVVAHEDGGLLVAPGGVGALHRALERLVADGGLRAALGARGRDRARAFAASAVLPRVERLYERARLGCPPAESRV